MRTIVLPVLALAAVAGELAAQSNKVTGLDGRLYNITSPSYFGRRGAAHPGGELGMAAQNDMCNPGTVTIPWQAVPQTNHPKFGFLVVRESDGRMVQISDRSYCKHAFTSTNGSSGTCVPCTNPGTGSVMGIGCSDTYGASTNAGRNNLGPPDEIDPWLGTWNMVASYFDRGDPDVGPPGNSDGVRSPINVGTDAVKNRITIKETDPLVPGVFYYQLHLIHQGEAVENRGDNVMTRGCTFAWNGTTWTIANDAARPIQFGSVLTRWTGATTNLGGNGQDDGRFAVAVKVTGPVAGFWHWEYAVHNLDNSRGGAALRILVCSGARVQNPGFRDIDGNALNQWTYGRTATEIAFTAPVDNPQNWNTIFNFWFDCDAAPQTGSVTVDEARVGPGALTVAVSAQTPTLLGNVWLGDGCGAPAPVLFANGVPAIPNAAYALTVQASPNAALIAFVSAATANIALGNNCFQYLDSSLLTTHGFLQANGAGLVTIPYGIPAGLPPIELSWQVAEIQNGGPVLGAFAVSNGLKLRAGMTGCQ